MQENSTDVLATNISTDSSVKPGVLMRSTKDPISDNYAVIFIAVALFTILYLILWYYCLKCCCYSISQCFEDKLITRGEVIHSAPQPQSICTAYTQNHNDASDSSPLMMSHDGVAPHFPPYPPPPRYEEIHVTSYQSRYQAWNPYPSLNQQPQQNSTVRVSNDPSYIRITPPPSYEDCFRI